jgi:GDP-D-mannose dehydratase
VRVLITGITGFVGSHMAEYALAQGAEVFGSSRWRSKTENIERLRSRITLLESDLRDLSSVQALVERSSPSHVIHLAAQSFVGASWQAPAETLSTNIISQVNLLEAIRGLKLTPRFLTVGSSEEYGLVYDDELPIRETNPLRPLSPYAVSKVAQDLMGYQYFKSYGLPIVRARAFNHSVGRYTPVLLRDDRTGLLDIRYISEIRRYRTTGYPGGRRLEDGTVVWDMQTHRVSVWAQGEWTKVIHVSCHPLGPGRRLLRLVSSGGIVEATGDHSVMAPRSGRHVAVSARDLSVGDRVTLVDLPRSEEMWLHEEVAWLLGCFVAEGSITGGKVRIDSRDPKRLERCAEVLLRHFGAGSSFTDGEGGRRRLTVGSLESFARWLRVRAYASDGNKRVPRSVLNAQADAKLAFLRGYEEGDDSGAAHGSYEFGSFQTLSPILSLGLCYLIANTTRQRISLDTEARTTGLHYLIGMSSVNEGHERPGSHLELPADAIKKIEAVPYDGEVWDLETEGHMFHAGLGRNLVHNTGPRRGDVFVESTFARQVAEIEAGLCEPVVEVGDLKPRRDYSDVRDIVRGYAVLLERGEPGEVYNLCSGRSWSVQHVLDFLLAQSTVKGIVVRVDPARLRPSDVMVIEGDPTKIEKATGWKAEIPLERTLTELLDYWRERVRRALR